MYKLLAIKYIQIQHYRNLTHKFMLRRRPIYHKKLQFIIIMILELICLNMKSLILFISKEILNYVLNFYQFNLHLFQLIILLLTILILTYQEEIRENITLLILNNQILTLLPMYQKGHKDLRLLMEILTFKLFQITWICSRVSPLWILVNKTIFPLKAQSIM